MSKVKIEGHGTGTGTFTVTTPSSNTDRTITLPDSTDTLAVNSDVTNKLPLAGGAMTGLLSHTLNVARNANQIRSNATNLLIENTHASGAAGIRFKGGNGEASILYGENNSTDKLYFMPRNDTSKQVIIDHVGNVTITGGNLVLGTSGKGIDFSANPDSSATNSSTDSEVLHSYEEGTWTPVYSGNIAFSTQMNFSYVKIGSIVKITGYCNGASGTFGSSWSVSGLPYTSNAAYNLAPLWSHGQDQDYMMYMNNGEAIMNIRDRDDANMNSMAQISFDCVYMTNQ
jgi:hypothetical protein